jgi:hypothetical protein
VLNRTIPEVLKTIVRKTWLIGIDAIDSASAQLDDVSKASTIVTRDLYTTSPQVEFFRPITLFLIVVPFKASRTRHDHGCPSSPARVDRALNEGAAVIGVWVETIFGTQALSFYDIFVWAPKDYGGYRYE